MKSLLDTDHLSILQRQSGPECAAIETRRQRHSAPDLGLSIISFHEQIIGCHAYINQSRNAREVAWGYELMMQLFVGFAQYAVLGFDASAAAEFDRLRARRVRIATMDLRTAAVALSRGLVLLTRNVRDFGKVPGLATDDWTV